MATPQQETFLPIPKGDISEGYVIYQDQLVLTSVYNQLRLRQRDASITPPELYLSQRMLNLQLESFAGGVKGADIVSWLQSTKTRLCICQVPESMWVATASGCLTGPAAVWFTNWASQEFDVTWATFRVAAKSQYSETFSPIILGTPLLAIKQTGSVPEYLAAWQQALAAAPKAVTNGNAMLLTLIINGLKPHICKWVPVGRCTSIYNCYKAIVEASNQASMGFCRTNNAPPQPRSAPNNDQSQVGRRQPRQQESATKRPRKGGAPASANQGPGKSLGVVATRGLTTPTNPSSQSLLAKNPHNYNLHEVETLDVFQVHSNDPMLQAAHSSNKVTHLSYPFRFRGNTHKLLVDTRADHTMVDQAFADSQQLDWVPSRFKAVRVADSRRVAITHETVPVRNAFLDILDNTLSLPTVSEWLAPSFSLDSAKKVGLVGNICSWLPELELETSSKSLFTSTKLKPRTELSSNNVTLNSTTVSLNSNQSLPPKFDCNQSSVINNNSIPLVVAPGDVGIKYEADTVLGLVSGPLASTPSSKAVKISPGPPVFCGEKIIIQAIPNNDLPEVKGQYHNIEV
ncbi:hypothetical protein DSO57_1013634 [Entomophthora muscae]|uniref:Uncharacterized protein n=1 Tax=Entomophthora muscae TaxID=34485 RepID=A0ACC2T632_9FUNG|nr:hypothetical protein DSO57_1013634 [Entomophthora muscae]